MVVISPLVSLVGVFFLLLAQFRSCASLTVPGAPITLPNLKQLYRGIDERVGTWVSFFCVADFQQPMTGPRGKTLSDRLPPPFLLAVPGQVRTVLAYGRGNRWVVVGETPVWPRHGGEFPSEVCEEFTSG
jgi:hypothetical protein